MGGALGLAILSTFASSRTGNTLAGLGHAPNQFESGSALVRGFHVAFAGGAVFLASGAILLALMLKRSDIERIDLEEPAPVAV